MKDVEIVTGIDTFTLYHVLTWDEKDKIVRTISKLPGYRDDSGDYESEYLCYRSECFADQGIKIKVEKQGKNPWGLYILLHPTLLLGETDRSALYLPDKNSFRRFTEEADALLNRFKVPCKVEDMKLNRADVTMNLVFPETQLVDAYLRILKKSLILPHYKLDRFREGQHKAKNCKSANDHSYTQRCRSASFFAYDKTAQLEMIDKFPASLAGKKVLRLEAQLRRKAMGKWTGKEDLDRTYKTLKALADQGKKIIRWYLSRMQQSRGDYLRYEDAMSVIAGIKSGKMRDRMAYLLRKTSDSRNLTSALEKLKEKYGLKSSQVNRILRRFQKLGISPITLPNTEKNSKLPPLEKIIRKIR